MSRPTEVLIFCAVLFSVSFASIEEVSTKREERNLFKEYMSRGLYKCSADYIHTLTQMHKFMKQAIATYIECEDLIRKTDKNYEMTPFPAMNEILNIWKAQDAQQQTAEVQEQTQELPVAAARQQRSLLF